MKRSMMLALLALSVGFFGGCADKEKGEKQFKEAETILKNKGEQKEAFKLFEKSCGNDYAKSCWAVSVVYVKGNEKLGIKPDHKKSVAFGQKAHDLNAEEACNFNKESAACTQRTETASKFKRACENVESQECSLSLIFGAMSL
ncbi:MAG: hypothetical protein LBP89_01020 [Helicobacteraceae bacterium]|jgi:TPR repeat protein|nr:hypothetical protein [Helicobacteraceae bacterium]